MRFENDRRHSAVFGVAQADPDVSHFALVCHLFGAAAEDDKRFPAFSFRTSRSRQPIDLPMPVPNALESASFAANRAAKWRAGNFIELEYAISPSVKTRWRKRSPKRSIEF